MFMNIYLDGDERHFWFSIMNGFVAGIFSLCLVYGSAIYPAQVLKRVVSETNVQPRSNLVSTNSNTSVSSDDKRSHQDKDKDAALNWTAMIARDIETLNRFMRYLCRSFCVENMLFLIEVMQFKQAMKECNPALNDTDIGIVSKFYDDVKDKDRIPRSSIVYNKNNFTMNQQIIKLYQKYIDENAALEVNISHETREKVSDTVLSCKFGDGSEIGELIKVFDDVIIEIHVLLSGLWRRFTSDQEYVLQLNDDVSSANEQIVIVLQDETKS